MKKATVLLAVLMMITAFYGCNQDAQPPVGLVLNEETQDPNATFIGAPFGDTTDDVNIRHDGTAATYVPSAPNTPSVTDMPSVPASTAKSGETRIRFLAAGDNIIHENVFLDARSRAGEGEKYNFIDMYDGIADIVADADIAFINQETAICGDDRGVYGYPNFNSPEVVGDTLIDLGFDIVNIANNHVLDMKESGYKATLDYWHEREDDILMIGGYYDKADYENIRVIKEQGVSIALLSYTYSTNGMYLSAGSKMHIPYIDKSEIVSMTKKAGELADLVFVVMHWGSENNGITSSQRDLAAAITEAGADVIIGMHPHIIQDMEWRTASDGSDTLVIYSLGNLLSTQYDNFNLVGGIVTFDIVKSEDGNIKIENPIYNPTVTHYNKQRLGLQVYLMEDYTEELVALHGNPNYGQTASSRVWTLDKIRSFATNNVNEEFLPDFLK